MSDSGANNMGRTLAGLGFLESLAARDDTAIHSLPPSLKIAGTFFFIVAVVSFGQYDFSGLLPFLIYPISAAAVLRIPWRLLLKRAALALPFVAFAGVANLIFDANSISTPFGFSVSGGILSFAVLILKTLLCVCAALILAASTPINEIAAGMLRLKIPCVLVLQFVLTCRYIEVILSEAARMLDAYMLRSPGIRLVRFKDWPMLVSQLFLRSIDRAERVYCAMLCRGFDARRTFHSDSRPKPIEAFAFAAFCSACIFFRFFNFSEFIGKVFCA